MCAAAILSHMSVAYEHYPELHSLVEQLTPEQASEARRALLRLVRGGDESRGGLRVLGVFDGPEESLGAQSEEIIRREAGGE
jgi:hypothetical protein